MSNSELGPLHEQATKKAIFKQHLAALGIGIFCLLVGVPLWWKTTEVYRFSLPYSQIQNLGDTKIEYSIEIEVVWAAGQETSASFLSNLSLKLKGQLASDAKDIAIPIYKVAARQAFKSEIDALAKASNGAQLNNLAFEENINKYTVFVVKSSESLKLPLITPGNSIFLPFDNADTDGLCTQISHLMKDIVRESTIKKTVESTHDQRKQRPDKDSMRAVSFNSGYDITFTLIVPEPAQVNAQWDIQGGINDYLKPLMNSLKRFTHLEVSSQVLYLTSIGSKAKKSNDLYYITESDLPHIINPLEANLGSHASNNPALSFIVYIPTRGRSPFFIHDKRGNPVTNNAFLSPQWGGVLIYNVDSTASNGTMDVSLDMHHIMEVFVTHLRFLLNIQPQGLRSDLKVVHMGSSELKQWELAGWLRCRCVENLVKSTNTLKSLAQLLEEISNIVINDEIGKEVETAVTSIKKSLQHLASGQLKEAFLESKNAIEASEKAFFDPSLLENLYFPEDQKFAIYIPLFLPISIPIVTSILQAIKYFKQKRKEKAD